MVVRNYKTLIKQ